jgi:hypothetical protein
MSIAACSTVTTMGQMASFLSRTPGATTGPVGWVHSVKLAEYGIWKGPLNDNDRANLLINMHEYFFPNKVDRSLAITEIRKKGISQTKGQVFLLRETFSSI